MRNTTGLVVYDNPIPSDMDFIMNTDSFPSSSTSPLSSTRSDAQSAPPDLEEVFERIYDEYSRCVHEAGRQLPPQWTMPDLVRMVLGDEALQHGFLTDAYYDVMVCGTRSWGCEELLNFIDLINYVF
ncbi:hypothetical protein ACP275_13G050900 [Erythranthe tilingii]